MSASATQGGHKYSMLSYSRNYEVGSTGV